MGKIFFYLKIIYFLFHVSISYSQLVILDKENLLPIPFVELYSDSGVFIGVSNNKGIINNELKKDLTKNNTREILFSHLSYMPKLLCKDSIFLTHKIVLTRNATTLENVVIRNKKQKDRYIKITGYFRSYQSYNSKLKYYIEGIVDYYIPINKKKGKKSVTHSYRTFVNLPIVLEEKKTNFHAIPTMPDKPLVRKITLLEYILKRDSSILHHRKKSTNVWDILIANKNKGGIDIDTLNNLLYIYGELISEDAPLTRRAFGNEVIFTRAYNSQYYKGDSLSDIQYENLLYQKTLSTAKYKIKKNEKYDDVKTVEEFFITEIDFTAQKVKANILENNFYKESNYSYPFWEDVKSDLYQPLPKSVEKALETTLTELENAHTETK